jgi:hypothetical protein
VILDRYLIRQVARPFLMVCLVLVLVFAGYSSAVFFEPGFATCSGLCDSVDDKEGNSDDCDDALIAIFECGVELSCSFLSNPDNLFCSGLGERVVDDCGGF